MKLAAADHRPWPLPTSRPAMEMVWHDLCFLHWPVPVESIRRAVPAGAGLEIDTFDGQAWIGVVPFRMSGVTAWGWPSVPGLSAFPELNVRTYVTHGGKPGVWFFSLDAPKWLAVRVARLTFRLPYMDARMQCEHRRGWVEYRSERTHRGEPAGAFEGRYRPTGPQFRSQPGSIEAFLTERYALYALGRGGRVLRGDIHHEPWPLRPAQAEVRANTMAAAAGVDVGDPCRPALCHFAERLEVPAWWPVACL